MCLCCLYLNSSLWQLVNYLPAEECAACIFSSASPTLKLPGFCRGGNSLKVARNSLTFSCAPLVSVSVRLLWCQCNKSLMLYRQPYGLTREDVIQDLRVLYDDRAIHDHIRDTGRRQCSLCRCTVILHGFWIKYSDISIHTFL